MPRGGLTLAMHSFNYTAKLVHTRCILSVLLSTLIRSRIQVKPATLLVPIYLYPFWQSPSHGAQPLGLACFTPEFSPGRAGPPSAPPAPKTCTVTQTYKSGSPKVPGGGEGQGVVLLGVPRNENLES